MTLKEIALELLQKYANAERTVIGEFSGHILKDEEQLLQKVDRYKAQIEELGNNSTELDSRNDELIRRQAVIELWEKYHPTIAIDAMGYDKALRSQPSAEPKIIRCKDCKHKPHSSNKYDYDNGDCGFEIIFPDYRCPCRCEDEYYNHIPDDDWYCGNAERRTDD